MIVSNIPIFLELNECDLNTDDCHDKAKCINGEGSYTCECIEGYKGDGFNCTGWWLVYMNGLTLLKNQILFSLDFDSIGTLAIWSSWIFELSYTLKFIFITIW